MELQKLLIHISKKFHYDGTIKAKKKKIYFFVNDAISATIKTIDKKFNNKSVLITGSKLMKIKNVMKTISEILKTNLKPSYKNKQELGHYNISPYSLKKKKQKIYLLRTKKILSKYSKFIRISFEEQKIIKIMKKKL